MNQENNDNLPVTGKKRSGKARMAGLSDDERKELAKKGAAKRWENEARLAPPLHAICGSEETPLIIGNISIPCYVLEDETRIITLDGMKAALGINFNGSSARLVELLAVLEAGQDLADELVVKISSTIRFITSENRKVNFGYPASFLVDFCESILESRLKPEFPERYKSLGLRAELLVRGFARVGIDALVDEATGFQSFRSRNALVALLQKYISNQLLAWTKTFPDEFYTEMFRLKGWDFANLKAGDQKPSVVGRYTKNIVYERMPVPIVQQLEKLNPEVEPGVRKHKHHQFLTREIGHPELKTHIEKVVMLMQLSDNWDDFRSKLRKVMPKKFEQFHFNDLLPDPSDAPPNYSEDGLD